MKKNGYRESTITGRVKLLRSLARRVDLFDPEGVKGIIALLNVSEGRKEMLSYGYLGFCRQFNLPFTPLRYQRIEQLPFIPLESEIDQLIAAMGKRWATYLQMLKETGVRPGEAWRLEWTDLDLNNHTLTINHPEKDSNPRKFTKLSGKLVAMLQRVRRPGKYVFHADNVSKNSFAYFGRLFFLERKRVAGETGNERLLRVNWKSLRHFKGTTEYVRTKDIVHVMRVLGHKSIKNTMIYINLAGLDEDENYVCKVATTKEERINLIEGGFTFVAKEGDEWYFRKRK